MLYAACIDGGLGVLGEDRPRIEQTIQWAIDHLLGENGSSTVPYTVEARASEGWLNNNEWMVRSENQVSFYAFTPEQEVQDYRRLCEQDLY